MKSLEGLFRALEDQIMVLMDPPVVDQTLLSLGQIMDLENQIATQEDRTATQEYQIATQGDQIVALGGQIVAQKNQVG